MKIDRRDAGMHLLGASLRPGRLVSVVVVQF